MSVTKVTQAGIDYSTLVDVLNGQIRFPVTQNASSDAHTLDDYEEGTYTPTLDTFAGGFTLGNGTVTGTYTKVGNLVLVHVKLVGGSTTVWGAGGSTWKIGLPFAVASGTVEPLGTVLGTDTGVGHYPGICNTAGGLTYFNCIQNGTNVPGSFTNTTPFTWGNTDIFRATIAYIAST